MKLVDQIKAIENKKAAALEAELDREYRDGIKIIAKAIKDEKAHVFEMKYGYEAILYFDYLTDEEVEIIKNSNFGSCTGALEELSKFFEVEVTCVIKEDTLLRVEFKNVQ